MAGRIPQNFIDDLLDRTDIVEIIDSRLSLRKTGRNYSALCPFHQEKSPSFSVNPDKQFYYCFGCGAGGNAIGFMMDFERIDFRDAVENLARNAGLTVPQEAVGDPEKDRIQRSLYDQLTKAQQFYEQQLRQHPRREVAVNYLKQRGLSGKVAQTFAIGYAPPGWENLRTALVQSDEDENQLIEAGVLITRDKEKAGNKDRSQSYDRFRDRVMFPIRDSRGRTIAFGGRVLGDEKPKYLNSPESPVFHKTQELYGLYEARQAREKPKRFLIVEGYMDVVALAQHGISYAVATLGTATSEAHLNKLFRMVPEVVFCFDGDKAGRAAAERALNIALPLMDDGRQLRFLFLPEGEDPDTMVRAEGADGFTKRMEKAQSLPDYFFQYLATDVDTDSLDGQARLSKLAMEKMAGMPKGVLYELMLDKLANITGISSERLLQHKPAENKAAPATSQYNDNAPPIDSYEGGYVPHDIDAAYDNYDGYEAATESRQRAPKGKKTFRPQARQLQVPPPAKRAIVALLHYPKLADEINEISSLECIDSQGIEMLIELIRLLRQAPDIEIPAIIAHWHGRFDEQETKELVRLSELEDLISKDNPTEFLHASLDLLNKHNQENELQRLIDKDKAKIEPLSEDERAQLLNLLTTKATSK